MRITQPKASLFALGLVAWSVPCAALAPSEPSASPLPDAATFIVDDTVLVPSPEKSEGASKADWGVQVGVFAGAGAAQAQLAKLADFATDYDLKEAQLVEPLRDNDENTVFRARFEGLTKSTARALCNLLGTIGEDCFVYRRDRSASNSSPGSAVGGQQPAGKEKASARSNTNLALAALRPIDDDALKDARGGFNVGGVNFNFGASVQTLVNGQLALQTSVQWTPAGAVVSQVQGLGTKIQTQVASTLANAGINVPAAKTAAQPLSSGSAPSQAAPALVTTGNSSSAPTSSLGNPGANAPIANNPAQITTAASPVAPLAPVLQSAATGGTPVTGGNIASLVGTTAPASLSSNPAANTPTTVSTPSSTSITVPITFTPASSSSAPALLPNVASNTASTGSGGAAPSINNPNLLSGVQIQSATGSTQVLANVANGQVQNIILNTASNQSIVQNTNIVLTIYNFSDWQQLLAQHAMAAQLASQVLAASGFQGH